MTMLSRGKSPKMDKGQVLLRKKRRSGFYRPWIEALEDRTLLSTVNWINPAGGDWNDPTNWDTGSLPGISDDVVIDVAVANVAITHSVGTTSIHSLLCKEDLTLSGGSFTVASTLQVDGHLLWTAGTLRGAQITSGTTIDAQGAALILDGATLGGTLNLTNAAGSTLLVYNGLTVDGHLQIGDAGGTVFAKVNLVNTQTIDGTGAIIFGSATGSFLEASAKNSTITLDAGLTIHGQNGTIGPAPNLGSSPNVTFINQGTIDADVLHGTLNLTGTTWTNPGTAEASNGGAINIAASGWTNEGTLRAASSGSVLINSLWSNPGRIEGNAGTLNLQGGWSSSGVIDVTDSTVNLGGNFTTPASFIRTGGTVNLVGGLINTGQTLDLNATTGSWNLAGGIIQGGTVRTTNGASLLVTATSTIQGITLDSNLNLAGVGLHIRDGLILNGTLQIGDAAGTVNAVVDLANTQTIDGSGEIVFGPATSYYTSQQSFLQAGSKNSTITLGAGLTVRGQNGTIGPASNLGTSPNVTFINQGTIDADVLHGTLNLTGTTWTNAGTVEATNNGTININAASGWTNEGTLRAASSGSVLTNGLWSNPGRIEANTGTLNLQGSWSSSGVIDVTNSTVNLSGGFTTPASFIRTGGSVNLVGVLINTGQTLDLNATTGSWNLAGGVIQGGTVRTTDAASLVATATSTFQGITLDGNLNLAGVGLHVRDGLILNGTLQIGDAAGTVNAVVDLANTQTIDGSGEIVFGPATSYYTSQQNFLQAGSKNSTITFGAGLTVRGQNGTIGPAPNLGTSPNVTFINQGTIADDVVNGTLNLTGTTWTNSGTVEASNGGAININAASGWTNDGTLRTASNGSVLINGLWSNPGRIESDAGILDLQGGWSSSGVIDVTNATVNLGGGFTTPASFIRTGGTVNLVGGLVNTGQTLDLNATTGSWNLAGGIIQGGTVRTTDGASLIVTGTPTIQGITLDGNLYVAGAILKVRDGLTLNGTLQIGDTAGTVNGIVSLVNTQTIDGTGDIVFGAATGSQQNYFQAGTKNITITLGPELTIHGQNGTIGPAPALGSTPNVNFVNQGTIDADVLHGTFNLTGTTWTNSGTIEATNGGVLNFQEPTWTNDGLVNVGNGSTFTSYAPSSNGIDGFTVAAGGTFHWLGNLTADGSNILGQGQLSITGSLLGNTQNADHFAATASVTFNGSASAPSPQLLEVMSQDLGNVSGGFQNNFAYGTLELGNATHVQLVDKSDNSPGNTPEALYVNNLVVPAGCTLDLNSLNVYVRTLRIDGSVFNGQVTKLPTDEPLPIVLNTPASSFLDSTHPVTWTFFGRASQQVSVVVNPGNPDNLPNPLQPAVGYVEVQILDKDGNVLASGNNDKVNTDVNLLGVTLPDDGTYQVVVSVPLTEAGSSGNYTIGAYDASATNNPLLPNQTTNGELYTPYEVDNWTFTAQPNDQVRFNLLNESDLGIRFDLTGPNGFVGFTGAYSNSALITLPAPGPYTVKAYTTLGHTGAYSFVLTQTSQTGLTLNTTYPGTLQGPGQALLFTITLSQAEDALLIDLADRSSADRNELYLSLDSAPTRSTYQYRSSNLASANQQILVPSAPTGTWYILLWFFGLCSG